MVPVLCILLLQICVSLAQFHGCPMISDPDTLAQLVAHTIATNDDDDSGSTPLPTVAVRNNHTVCLSVGPEADTVSSISLLVEYECSGHMACSPSGNDTTVEQFDFGCVAQGDGNVWSARQFGRLGYRVPTASFSTPLRRDCSACIEKGVADAVGIAQLLYLDSISRCLSCSSGCANIGMGLCFGMGSTMCCNYLFNGSCVNLCPNNTIPDSNFICRTVVVGFREKVYLVEEEQPLIILPVIVKGGQLLERVVLRVTTEDRTATVGDDYRLSNRRVELIPGVNNDSGWVEVRIVNDHYPEDNEDLVVHLEHKSGSSASVDVSSTILVIIGDQDDEEPSTKPNTTTTLPPTFDNGCEPQIDEVWTLNWPNTAQGDIASIPCGLDNKGIATRDCLMGGIWAAPNISLCENIIIAEIGKMAEMLFSQPDLRPVEALVVVHELKEAATAVAVSDISQLPRDINTASDIIARTVDLLLQSMDNSSAMQLAEVSINETVVILDVLSIFLTDKNQNGFTSLHSEGSGTGSRALLNSAEMYGQYVGQTFVDDETETEIFSISRENLVLNSVRRNSDDFRSSTTTAGRRHDDVVFPRMNSMPDFITTENVPASVTVPGALLDQHYEGNISVTRLFFRDLHNLLPDVFNNGTTPRSFVISSQIYGRRTQQSSALPFEDTAFVLTFRLELNDTDQLPRCAFWDFSRGVEVSRWSTVGLRTESLTREGASVSITCSSSHLTSFAVLVDVGGAKIDHKPLKVISYIGISISLACLFLTIIFFASIGKKLFSTVHNFVHLNLSISLFVAYIIFAVCIEVATSNEAACKAVAALIQYFLLSAFCWMMCEGVMLYLMLVVVFSKFTDKWWFFFLIGWGPPLIFVTIGLSTVLDEYGVRDSNGELLYCWLASGSGKYAIWTFVAPMLGIITVNSVFLVLVLRSIYISKSGQDSRKKKGAHRYSLATYIVKASVILLPLLGLTWVFGLFAVNENTAVFAWLFTIFNSLQGVSIFVMHVIRNDRVWGRLRKSMIGPDGFIRSMSRRTASTSGSARYSKKHEGSDTEVEMREHSHTVSSNSMVASHMPVDLEDVFEPREHSMSPTGCPMEETPAN